ncbi:MAG: hypothetical protein VCC00_01700 [Deltaproteobacteria bacterium]
MLKRSDFVFHGEVTKIQYSDPAGPANSISIGTGGTWAPILEGAPHTFVTLRVLESLRGRTKSEEFVTLRFYGGPDGKGSYYATSLDPTFVMGERQILFVRGNGTSETPLVGGHGGQIREFAGGAYSSSGVALVGLNDNRRDPQLIFDGGLEPSLSYRSYPAPSFAGLRMRDDFTEMIAESGLSETAAWAEYENNAPREIVEFLVEEPVTAPGTALSIEDLLAQIRLTAQRVTKPRAGFISQDPYQPFSFVEHKLAAGPKRTTRKPTDEYDPDRWSASTGSVK